uniref:Uncharacterized protein n=1 Tax=Pseudomonas putida TaxID=303 RepID=A0A6B7Q137_PSEPU|nr:hypothetical protein [Pseudomonas putida]
MRSESAEVPVRRWKIGLPETEVNDYEAYAEFSEPRLDSLPAFVGCVGIHA